MARSPDIVLQRVCSIRGTTLVIGSQDARTCEVAIDWDYPRGIRRGDGGGCLDVVSHADRVTARKGSCGQAAAAGTAADTYEVVRDV